MSLAIFTDALHKPSETFIRNHITSLRDEKTVIITRQFETDTLGMRAITGVGNNKSVGFFPIDKTLDFVRDRIRSRLGPSTRLPLFQNQKIVGFLRSNGIKFVFAEYLMNGVYVANAAKEANCKLFVHAHGYDATKIPEKYEQWAKAYRRLFPKVDGIFAPSHYLADKVIQLGCPPHKVIVSPCGVDVDQFQGGLKKRDLFLSVGRFVEKKAPHLTIRAFAEAAKNFPDAQLLMIGDGPLKPQCEELIRKLKATNQVKLLGWRSPSEVASIMSEASVFMLHSVTSSEGDTEGLPVSILEAMASENAVISTTHSGIPEAVLHKSTGILVEERDFNGMTQAISLLLEKPAYARQLGRAGRKVALDRYSLLRTNTILREVIFDGRR